MLINRKAFTLIELLVVVLIIGILAAVALPQYNFLLAKVKAGKMFALLKPIDDATYRYYLTNAAYPELNNWDVLDITIPNIQCASDGSCTAAGYEIHLMNHGHMKGNYVCTSFSRFCITSVHYNSPDYNPYKGKYSCLYKDNFPETATSKKVCEAICGTNRLEDFTTIGDYNFCWFNNWNI
jgi:prepilin-type N-terminal cleavage/methylation domain-containing protein